MHRCTWLPIRRTTLSASLGGSSCTQTYSSWRTVARLGLRQHEHAGRTFSTANWQRNQATDAAPRSGIASPTSERKPADTFDYEGPLTNTFRRLKIFSLASLGLSCTLSPLIFIIESNLPNGARFGLLGISLGYGGISTALIGWCSRPYVTTMRRLHPDTNNGLQGLEMTTITLTLKRRITRVYDPAFLVDANRYFATWQLAEGVKLSSEKRKPAIGSEETIAETFDSEGSVIGRWVVTWAADGYGNCRAVGTVQKYFMVHSEFLNP